MGDFYTICKSFGRMQNLIDDTGTAVSSSSSSPCESRYPWVHHVRRRGCPVATFDTPVCRMTGYANYCCRNTVSCRRRSWWSRHSLRPREMDEVFARSLWVSHGPGWSSQPISFMPTPAFFVLSASMLALRVSNSYPCIHWNMLRSAYSEESTVEL